jgi:magnesium chelatase family protein
MKAPRVTVEVHMANGLPSFTLVGLADTEVREARERVRSALQNSGLDFPTNQRIVVNLAPADLPKDSGRFDLPIAIGILAASGQLDEVALRQHVFAGELSLSGELRPVRGALAMARSADPNSASAQFYIALKALPELDGRYAVFGRVTQGMEVVDEISQGDRLVKATLVEGGTLVKD